MCVPRSPRRPSHFYAFSYTVPGAGGFVVAGSGVAGGADGPYGPRIVRHGDHSPDGMREKARFVLRAMAARRGALEQGWAVGPDTQLYTIYEVHGHFADEFIRRGAAPAAYLAFGCRPPVQGLDYEIDVRGVAKELVI